MTRNKKLTTTSIYLSMSELKGEALQRLREEQLGYAKKVKVKDDFGPLRTVAGVDVAYDKELNKAFSACIVFDYETGRMMDGATSRGKIPMPYIPTYLTFRELPLIEKVLKKLRSRPTILMVDGNGILHPHRIGLASHVGVKLNIPTIGVAKKLLFGDILGAPIPGGRPAQVKVGGRTLAYAYLSNEKVTRPIFISPGHRVSLRTTLKVVKRFSKFRIPEPIRHAHHECTNDKNWYRIWSKAL